MSIRIMSRVWDAYPGGGSDLLALLALADWSDDDGRCFPSMSAIAAKTRLSRSQAQRIVHGLIDSGFVEVLGNEFGGAPGATRQYRIVLSSLTGRIDATPTGRMGATGSAHATGGANVQDGLHGCAETGRMGATQTVSEPSTTVKGSTRTRFLPSPKSKSKEVTLFQFQESCKSVGDGFSVFWNLYPKKVAKAEAEKAWKRLNPSKPLLAGLLAGLERQKALPDWTRDGGKFIPYPATWLNGRRWEDEAPLAAEATARPACLEGVL